MAAPLHQSQPSSVALSLFPSLLATSCQVQLPVAWPKRLKAQSQLSCLMADTVEQRLARIDRTEATIRARQAAGMNRKHYDLVLQRLAAQRQRVLAGTQRGVEGSNPVAVPVAVPAADSGLAPGSSLLAAATGVDVPSWLLPAAAGVAVGGAVAAGTAFAVSRSRKRGSSSRSKKAAGKSRSRQGSRVGKGGVVRGKRDRNRPGGAVKDRYRGRKVYRTKRGQPYILMANGKARFVRA